nr:immunoglobulin heavy chain junction region [Macaca mulatta]
CGRWATANFDSW